jgi:hypothetical protein
LVKWISERLGKREDFVRVHAPASSNRTDAIRIAALPAQSLPPQLPQIDRDSQYEVCHEQPALHDRPPKILAFGSLQLVDHFACRLHPSAAGAELKVLKTSNFDVLEKTKSSGGCPRAIEA